MLWDNYYVKLLEIRPVSDTGHECSTRFRLQGLEFMVYGLRFRSVPILGADAQQGFGCMV